MAKWIGVDLDGTLAKSSGRTGAPIGKAVPGMMDRVRQWISEGREVRIFTARADTPSERYRITEWLKDQGLPALPITNRKDSDMEELWDDRAIRVQHNKGEPCPGCGDASRFSSCYMTTC